MAYIVSFAVMAGVWLVWSGIFTPLMLVLGLIGIFLCLWMARRMKVLEGAEWKAYYTLRAPLYLLWLLKEIALSTLQVARRVWQVNPAISPSFGWVKTSQKSEEARVLYANSITLTPGTVSCDVKDKEILVHALEASGLASLKEGTMDRNVTRSYEE